MLVAPGRLRRPLEQCLCHTDRITQSKTFAFERFESGGIWPRAQLLIFDFGIKRAVAATQFVDTGLKGICGQFPSWHSGLLGDGPRVCGGPGYTVLNRHSNMRLPGEKENPLNNEILI